MVGPRRIMPPPTSNTQSTTVPPLRQMVELPLGINLPTQTTRYNTVDLKSAIESGREIGQGATSTVYYGVLEGRGVAIKRFKPDYGQQDFEVRNFAVLIKSWLQPVGIMFNFPIFCFVYL